MKATNDCYECLARLVRQATEMATEDPELRNKAIAQGLYLLERDFSLQKTTVDVATPLHRVVRSVTGNPDPYRRLKDAEVTMVLELQRSLDFNPDGDLRNTIVFAVRGNVMDFFKDIAEIKRDLDRPVVFAIDALDKLERRLEKARSILYLADNTGEVYFDLPLVKMLQEYAPLTYVVKESPVQNDITFADLKRLGLSSKLPRVITTGTDTPGVVLEMASPQFKAEFEAADLVLAKGMGYWETLSEHPPQGKVFHLLKAKCQPVSASIGVPLDSYVAMLR